LNPSDAEASYQWQICDTADGIFENIAGAEASTYTLADQDETKYIQVKVTGTGAFTGTVTSAAIGPVEPKTLITAIDAISGKAQAGMTLEAGALKPTEAEAAYQWQICDTADGIFENIAGAEESSYTLTESDIDCYIRVTATGTGGYTGTVASNYVGPVTASDLLLIMTELKAQTTTESGLTVTGSDLKNPLTVIGPEIKTDAGVQDNTVVSGVPNIPTGQTPAGSTGTTGGNVPDNAAGGGVPNIPTGQTPAGSTGTSGGNVPDNAAGGGVPNIPTGQTPAGSTGTSGGNVPDNAAGSSDTGTSN
jgi:hypothetical protein